MRGWGSRRDANLRSRVQLLESRQRLAVTAVDEFTERLNVMALELLSLRDLAELIGRLMAIRAMLTEEGGR
jgi:hypothetical protein